MNDQVDSTLSGSEDAGGNQDASQTAEVSETQAGNLPVGAALVELIEKDEIASELLRRRDQSTKDRGISEANKNASEALDGVQRLMQYFSPEDQQQIKNAQQQMMLEEMYKERYSPQVSGMEQKVEAQAPASSVDLLEAFKATGYDLGKISKDDIEFADGFKSQTELKNALLKRNAQKPTDPASIVQGSGGNVPLKTENMSMEVATAQLEALRLKYAASKRPKEVQEQMDALDKVLEEGMK